MSESKLGSVSKASGRWLVRVGLVFGFSLSSLLLPGVASAHTELTTSSPAKGANIKVAPAQVELTFTEPIEVSMASIGVRDGSNAVVDQGKPFVVRNSANVIGVALKPNSQGVHTVTWRLTASDGHPISGKFTFTVGDATTTTKAPAVTSPPTTAASTTSSTVPTTDPSTVTTAPANSGLEELPQTREVAATNAADVETTPPYLPFFVVAIVVGVVAAVAVRRRA